MHILTRDRGESSRTLISKHVVRHQIITNIFENSCITIISNPHFCHVSGEIVSELDLKTLEHCNQTDDHMVRQLSKKSMSPFANKRSYSMLAMDMEEKRLFSKVVLNIWEADDKDMIMVYCQFDIEAYKLGVFRFKDGA